MPCCSPYASVHTPIPQLNLVRYRQVQVKRTVRIILSWECVSTAAKRDLTRIHIRESISSKTFHIHFPKSGTEIHAIEVCLPWRLSMRSRRSVCNSDYARTSPAPPIRAGRCSSQDMFRLIPAARPPCESVPSPHGVQIHSS